MSTKSIKQGLSAIANEVLEDVSKEAKTILGEAETQAKETLRRAKEDADRTYKTIIDEATAKTQAEKRRIESLTEVEARNRLLQTKEALVDEMFKKARAKLEELVKTDVYHEQLLRLIEEAAMKMTSKSLIVIVNADDKAWLTRDKLGQLSKRTEANLIVAEKPENFLGGCKVQTLEGDVTYDSTIESSLNQRKSELRLKAAKIMFGEAKENAI